jgi:hypothetical protein
MYKMIKVVHDEEVKYWNRYGFSKFGKALSRNLEGYLKIPQA